MLKLIAKTVLTAVVAGGLCAGGVARADEMPPTDPAYKKQGTTQQPSQQQSPTQQQSPMQYVKPQPKPMPPVYQQQYVKPFGKQWIPPMPQWTPTPMPPVPPMPMKSK